MTKPPPTIPSTISPAARAFLRDATLPEPRVITETTIAAIREANAAAYAPAAEAMRDAYLDSVEDVEISGVRVQVCTPKGYDPSKDDRAVLYFFGGSYVMGSPLEDLAISARLAQSLGLKIYAPYYRLAPEHPFPAALDDGVAVYKALAGTFSPGNLAVVGESAGGNLAVVTTLRARDEGLQLPSAVAVMSPWADLTLSSESFQTHRGLDPTFAADNDGVSEAEAYGGGRDLTEPLISPVYAENWTKFPPTLITTGTRDLLMSDSARLSTVLRRAGVEVSLNLWEGMWHVFEYYPEIPEGQQSLEEIARFLARHLRRG
jgi:acetyl esterase/lipase